MRKRTKSITITIDKQLVDWIEEESQRKDELSNQIYRNRSHLVEKLIAVGKNTVQSQENS